MSITFTAELRSVKDYFSIPDGQCALKIPVYQRRYEWDDDNCTALFDDLINHVDESEIDINNLLHPNVIAKKYLLGSIILLKNLDQERFLIDGQQRTTTLTLLACAFHKRLSEINLDRLNRLNSGPTLNTARVWIESIFRRTTPFAFDASPILEVNYGSETYNSIVLTGNAQLLDITDITSIKFKKTYELFIRLIDDHLFKYSIEYDLQFDRLIVIVTAAVHNLVMLVLTAQSPLNGDAAHDEAIGIFSTLNTRGLNLALSDKIKASLFAKLPNVPNAIIEWDRRFSHMPTDEIDAFFVSLISSIKNDFPKNTMKAWSSELQDIEPGTKGQIFWREKFLRAFDFYKETVSNNASISSLFLTLPFGEWRGPLISSYDNANPAALSKKLLRICFCFCVTGAYEKSRKAYLRKIIWNQGDDRYAYENLVEQSIERLKDLDIYLLPSPKRNFILRTISYALLGDQMIIGGNDHIEHVLPQNYNLWLDDEWTETEVQRWLHKIGNLVYLPAAVNAAISNLPYVEKLATINNRMTELNLIARVNAHGLRLPLVNMIPPESWTPEVVQGRQDHILGLIEKWLQNDK